LALSVLVSLNVLNSIATLLLLSLGIGVIYGMMKVINFAHGEFLMLGAYATVITANAGVNIWIAMLIVAPLSVGLFGLVVERCLIRHLYGRIIDTMLATWGLSLIIVGLVTSFIGTTIQGVSTPLGGLSIGSYQTSVYNLFIIVMAALVTLVLWATLRFTRYGMIVRATMQNPAMASALGVSPSRIYMGTCWGLLSPGLPAASSRRFPASRPPWAWLSWSRRSSPSPAAARQSSPAPALPPACSAW
jgi:branched-subunit amino acid ABC-type transport system permease component